MNENERECKLKGLREWMEEREKGVRVLIVGDFNARTGKKGGGLIEVNKKGEREGVRNSKDGKVNGKDRKLYEFLERQQWTILYRNVRETRKENIRIRLQGVSQ